MKVYELQNQIQYCLDNNYIDENDEIIMIGSGDRESGFFDTGLIMPTISEIKIKEHKTGFYGIGVLKNKTKIR